MPVHHCSRTKEKEHCIPAKHFIFHLFLFFVCVCVCALFLGQNEAVSLVFPSAQTPALLKDMELNKTWRTSCQQRSQAEIGKGNRKAHLCLQYLLVWLRRVSYWCILRWCKPSFQDLKQFVASPATSRLLSKRNFFILYIKTVHLLVTQATALGSVNTNT